MAFVLTMAASQVNDEIYEEVALPEGAHILAGDEAWERVQDLTYVLALQPRCDRLFFAISGFHAHEMLEDPWWTVSFPDAWTLGDEASAQAVCLPPHIAIAPGFIDTYGSLYASLTYLHELLHIATCWRVYDEELTHDEWQELSKAIETICLASLYDQLLRLIEKP